MVGSLVMARVRQGQARARRRVGTGFKDAVARSLRDQLERLKRPTSPFPNKLPADAVRGVRWVEPKLVAEVELRGWTSDGLLRHASYKGLREDKDPSEVVRETRPRGGEPPGRRQRLRAHPSRPAAVARRRTHEAGLGGVLRGHCRLGAAAPDRATVVPRAVPVRNGKQMLLPEARLGGHGRVSQAAGHRRRRGALSSRTSTASSPSSRQACWRSIPGARRSPRSKRRTG